MMQRLVDDHDFTSSRHSLGSRAPFNRPSYGTTARCSCREWDTRVNEAPSTGGTSEARRRWFEHLKNVLSATTGFWRDTTWHTRRMMSCELPIADGSRCARSAMRRFGQSTTPAVVLACKQHAALLGDPDA